MIHFGEILPRIHRPTGLNDKSKTVNLDYFNQVKIEINKNSEKKLFIKALENQGYDICFDTFYQSGETPPLTDTQLNYPNGKYKAAFLLCKKILVK